jgi:hypothetical protein
MSAVVWFNLATGSMRESGKRLEGTAGREDKRVNYKAFSISQKQVVHTKRVVTEFQIAGN